MNKTSETSHLKPSFLSFLSCLLVACLCSASSSTLAGSWNYLADMATARYDHTATSLNDGRVLITGGTDGTNPLQSSEIFDSATGTWSAAWALGEPLTNHTATLLATGDVLVAGGSNGSASTTPRPCSPAVKWY